MIQDHLGYAHVDLFHVGLDVVFGCHIISFFIHNFDSFNVVTNSTTITRNIFLTKFCLLYCFFWCQAFCFFFCKLIDSSYFLESIYSYLYFVFNWLKAATVLALATRAERRAKRLFLTATSSAITIVLSKKASMTGLRTKS